MTDDVSSIGVYARRADGASHWLSDDEDVLDDLVAGLRGRWIAAGMGSWTRATLTLGSDGTFELHVNDADVSDLGARGRPPRCLAPRAPGRWSVRAPGLTGPPFVARTQLASTQRGSPMTGV
jgi:hypothetical protein